MFKLAAGLLSAVLETDPRVQVHHSLPIGKERRLECARAAIGDVLPEDSPVVLDAGGALGTVHRRADARLDKMDAGIHVLEAHEVLVAGGGVAAADAERHLYDCIQFLGVDRENIRIVK